MKTTQKVGGILFFYAAMFAACVALYYKLPNFRDDLRFWVPQVFVLVLIAVTSLYVLFTADLVNETRSLQQRPLLELSFREIAQPSLLRLDKLYTSGQSILEGVAKKLVGGTELPAQTRCLAIELKNIGQMTVRNLFIKVKLTAPPGNTYEEREFVSDIRKDEFIQITVVPAAIPWMVVEVESLVYGDGLRKHTEFTGNRVFTSMADAGT